MKPIILAIDTSCDETAAAVVSGRRVLSNIVSSQALLHRKFGGVVPDLARLEHEKRIDKVITMALSQAKVTMGDISHIAVTSGPGLAIALEIGVRMAIKLAEQWNLPVIPVNHMAGHFMSALAQNSHGLGSQLAENFDVSKVTGFLVSGNHTELVSLGDRGRFIVHGEAMDDACGESFDKIARLLGLGYPGGKILAKLAGTVRKQFKRTQFKDSTGTSKIRIQPIDTTSFPVLPIELVLPIPLSKNDYELNFSYSGIKTAFWQLLGRWMIQEGKATEIKVINEEMIMQFIGNQPAIVTSALCLLYEEAAIAQLMSRLKNYIRLNPQTKTVMLGGGVVANIYFKRQLNSFARTQGLQVVWPYTNKLNGDNAAMIGVVANLILTKEIKTTNLLDRNPSWRIDQL